LLTQFGKIAIMWFDFSYSQRDWGWSRGKGKEDWESEKLLAMVRELQPGILVVEYAQLLNDASEINMSVIDPMAKPPIRTGQCQGTGMAPFRELALAAAVL
jgi:alpha-L-fucosidase